MALTEETVLKVIREAVSGKKESFPSDSDWKAVEKEMENQAVLPLAYNVIDRKCIPEGELRDEWVTYIINHIGYWYRMLDIQNELVQILTEAGCKFAIMKGFANAAFYPKPEIRTTGDVDFLVERERFDEFYQLLQIKGYEPAGHEDSEKHHMNLTKNGVLFEMHKRPAGTMRKYSSDNQKVIDYFNEGLNCTDTMELYGYTFPVLDPVRNGLMLLMHTAGHLQNGIGIRHLLDWGLYAEKYLTDDFWNNGFREAATGFKVDTLALTMTRICQKELKLCSDRKWCKGADDKTCAAFFAYLMRQGNFGRKAGQEDAAAKFFTESMNTDGFFKRLDRSSRYSMPIVDRYPVLRPVGWIYQIGRYIKRGLHRVIITGNLHNDMEAGRQRRKFMENLGVESWLKSDGR